MEASMRPRIPYQLRLKLEPQPEDRAEEFRHALRDFIEAMTRLEIERLKAKTVPLSEVVQLPHFTPLGVAGGTQSK
jgi:hypothetical protein